MIYGHANIVVINIIRSLSSALHPQITTSPMFGAAHTFVLYRIPGKTRPGSRLHQV